jgi:hypothetical protein
MALALAAPGAAGAQYPATPLDPPPPVATAQDVREPCPGDRIDDADPRPRPDRVVTGTFTDELEGGYVFVPFRVSRDATAIRVRYCYEQTGNSADDQDRSTLDLGLYEPRADGRGPWGTAEFRGWGGSSHPDVVLSREGFTSADRYAADPEQQVPGKTTRAFLPGRLPPGRWAAELGVAAVASSGTVPYRVEIELSDDRRFANQPYSPASYDGAPVSREPGWYAGDFHVHGEHSALGDAPLAEVFDYAFGSLREGQAGLDFITLSDYVSGSSWGEVGRYQERYPNRLIVRSAEVITYRGHFNSHANTRVTDYRHGPLFVRERGGRVDRVRGARPAGDSLERVQAVGGFTQINHPTIFPSPPFPENQCRGCAWEYSDAETDYSSVDAVEIATGPAEFGPTGALGPNPFTVTGIQFWEEALAAGHKIAAVGSSDSHNAGLTPGGFTQSPIGTATTVVRTEELSPRGIGRAVKAGHTYVKVTGNDAPDLRFRATAAGAEPAIMGDTLRSGEARFTAQVLGGGPAASLPGPRQLIVLKDGVPLRSTPVTSDRFEVHFESSGAGRYRLQLQRGSVIEAVSSPIYLERGGEPGALPTCAGRRATIVGSPSDDTLRGTSRRDVVVARAGADVVRGRDGRDIVCGGRGADVVGGGSASDWLLGRLGRDDLGGARGRDRLGGGRSADEIRGGGGSDRLTGGRGPDVLRGGSGRDRMAGGAGRDDVQQ